MMSTRIALLASLTLLSAVSLPAQSTITGGTCAASNLSGPYGFTLTGRAVSAAGLFTGSYQANGTATFDGVSKVTFTLTANTNLAQGKQVTYSGTYTVPSNCYGTLTISNGASINFSLAVWGAGSDFNITGSDATYAYSGTGSPQPAACVNASLSGSYGYTSSGFTLAGSSVTGTGDEAGLLQFDGQGNLTAAYTTTTGGTPSSLTASGTYAVTAACLGSATLVDSNGKSTALNFAVTNVNSSAFSMIESNSQFVRDGTAHSSFLNPAQSIGNVASYAVNSTPPGSVFVLFGLNLATRPAGATTTTLPTTLLNTTVSVNGEAAPLFYVDPGQIDAQMPWDIPAGSVATVIVKNGTSTSNAAAVLTPTAASPGISVYGNNRAVVVNTDGSVNSASDTASVGDEVVAYFTGGGAVTAAGKLVTGSPAPAGLSPVTGSTTITVNGVQATPKYVGLTPGSIGLYQANFIVPQVVKGSYPVVITIAGQASNNPVMTVGN